MFYSVLCASLSKKKISWNPLLWTHTAFSTVTCTLRLLIVGKWGELTLPTWSQYLEKSKLYSLPGFFFFFLVLTQFLLIGYRTKHSIPCSNSSISWVLLPQWLEPFILHIYIYSIYNYKAPSNCVIDWKKLYNFKFSSKSRIEHTQYKIFIVALEISLTSWPSERWHDRKNFGVILQFELCLRNQFVVTSYLTESQFAPW